MKFEISSARVGRSDGAETPFRTHVRFERRFGRAEAMPSHNLPAIFAGAAGLPDPPEIQSRRISNTSRAYGWRGGRPRTQHEIRGRLFCPEPLLTPGQELATF
jgi:hypothetical protein